MKYMVFPMTWAILIRKAGKVAWQGRTEEPMTHRDSRCVFPLVHLHVPVSAQSTGSAKPSLMEWLNAHINYSSNVPSTLFRPRGRKREELGVLVLCHFQLCDSSEMA